MKSPMGCSQMDSAQCIWTASCWALGRVCHALAGPAMRGGEWTSSMREPPAFLPVPLLPAPRIIGMLSTEERGLFRERIRYLDRKIHPGLKKLHWSYKGASAAFISECRLHASKVRGHVLGVPESQV